MSQESQVKSITDDKETLDALKEVSSILNTGLNSRALTICIQLIESGVNPEALAAVVRDIRRKNQVSPSPQAIAVLYAVFEFLKVIKVNLKMKSEMGDDIETVAEDISEQGSSRLKVRIKNWTAVAAWRWIAKDDSCGICQQAFDMCCATCTIPGDDCPLVWGRCSHCFHMHCIEKWLQSQTGQQQCPMCRQEWKYKE